MAEITSQQFEEVEIRVGKILHVEDFPKARNPSYKLWMDFGEFGEKKSSARLTKLYSKEDLVGKTILAVVNFPRRQIADFMSDVLVLGVMISDEEVVLVHPDREVTPGARIL